MATKKTPAETQAAKPVRRKAAQIEAPIVALTETKSSEEESNTAPEVSASTKPESKSKTRTKATPAEVTEPETVFEETQQATVEETLEAEVEPEAAKEKAPVRFGRKSKQATAESLAEPEAQLDSDPVTDLVDSSLAKSDVEVELDQAEVDQIDEELLDEDLDVEDIEVESTPRPERKSLWQIIKSWFTPKARAVEEEIEPVAPELTPEELERRVAEAIKELEISEARVSEIQAINQDKQLLAESLKTRVDEIQDFIARVERSYFWRVQKRMESDLSRAKANLSEFEEAVKNVETPETGRLIELRKAFHKSVAVSSLVTGIIAAITFFYPIIAYISPPDWAQTIFESDAFSSLLVALVVAAYGIIYLIRRFGGSEKFPVSRIIGFTVIIAFLVALFIMWPEIGPAFIQNVIPFLQQFLWQILTACAAALALAVIVSLLVYYQGWSIFRRDVTELLTKLSNVIEGYVKTQQEVSRLENLYKQTSDWLEILAHSLYRPWKTHPDWEGTREFENHYSTFPFALRVAQAKEERDSRMAELERLVGGRLLVQGWRADAFDDMVDNAGLEMGLQEGKFTTEVLDADLPHQTNNSRALLLRFLKNSAKSQMAGKLDLETTGVDENGVTTVKPSDKYLVEVAKVRLLDLIDKTQSIVLSEARPRVLHIQDDPLEELREDQGGIEEYDPTHSWDEFLKESLGTDEVAQPPMGILNFSEKGRISRVQEEPDSFIITPKRLFSSLPPTRSEKIVIVPVGDEKSRAVEIIARVDVVGPIAFDQIALLSGESVSESENMTSSWDDNEVL
jgi:hypothetical protein